MLSLDKYKKHKEERKEELKLQKQEKQRQKQKEKAQLSLTAKKQPKKQKPTKAIKVQKPKKKKKPTSNKKIKKQCLLLAKQIVYKRDKDICQHCKVPVSWSNRHASHVIPVSRDGRLALDPLNMKVLCYHCHLNWRHKHPIEAGEWFTKTFPKRWEVLKTRYADWPKGTISVVRLEEWFTYLQNYDEAS